MDYAFNISDEDLILRLGSFAESPQLLTCAASIGLDEVDECHAIIFKKLLPRIPYISSREHRAADIIEDLIGLRPEVVLDSTLLLAPSDWRDIEVMDELPFRTS